MKYKDDEKLSDKYESLKQQADMLYEALKSVADCKITIIDESVGVKILKALKTYESFIK